VLRVFDYSDRVLLTFDLSARKTAVSW